MSDPLSKIIDEDRVGYVRNRPLARPPVVYQAPLNADVAHALETYAHDQQQPAETIIAEAVRAYLGAV